MPLPILSTVRTACTAVAAVLVVTVGTTAALAVRRAADQVVDDFRTACSPSAG